MKLISKYYMEKTDILKIVIWGQFELMSLHPQPIPPVPEQTVRVAKAAFPKGNIYLQIRDTLGSIYVDEDFANLFSSDWSTRSVTLAISFNLCHAVQVKLIRSSSVPSAVRGRIDWKYALSLPLEDSGFDFSAIT